MTGRPRSAPDAVLTRRGAAWGAFAAACVVVLLGVLIARAWPPLLELDQRIATSVHAWALRTPWAVDAARVLETIGRFRFSFWVVLGTTALLLLARRWRHALALVLVAALAPWITDLIKPVVGRARPVWETALGSEATLSYPSGHATAGIAVYAACGIALGGLLRDPARGAAVAALGLLLGISIGLSRVVLGVHWPSDVVGGWCVALAVGGAMSALLVLPIRRGT